MLSPSNKLNVSVDKGYNEIVDDLSVDRSRAPSLDDIQFEELKPSAVPFGGTNRFQAIDLPDHLPDKPSEGTEEMIVEYSSSVSPSPSRVVFSVPKVGAPASFQGHADIRSRMFGKTESDIHYVYCGEVDGKFGFLSASSKIPTNVDRLRAYKEGNEVISKVAKRFHGETPEFRRAVRKWVKPCPIVSYPLPVNPLTRPDRIRCSSARAAARKSVNGSGLSPDDITRYLNLSPDLLSDEDAMEKERLERADRHLDDFGDKPPQVQRQEPEEENQGLDGGSEADKDLELYLRWLKQKAPSPTPQKRPTRILTVRKPSMSSSRPCTPSDMFGPIRRPVTFAEFETRGKAGSRVGVIGSPARMSPRASSDGKRFC